MGGVCGPAGRRRTDWARGCIMHARPWCTLLCLRAAEAASQAAEQLLECVLSAATASGRQQTMQVG